MPRSAQRVEARLRVRNVGRRHDRRRAHRPGAGFVDHASPSAWHDDVSLHLEQRRGWRNRSAGVLDQIVAVLHARCPQRLDVEAAWIVHAAGDRRHRNDPAPAAHHLARQTTADLAEALDRHRPAIERSDCRFRCNRDSEPGDEILEDDAVDELHDRMGVTVSAQGYEICLRRPEVCAREERPCLDHWPDLVDVPTQRPGTFSGPRPHAGLCSADAATQHGELVRHRTRQQRDLGLGHVRRETRSTGADARAIDVEHDEGINRLEAMHTHHGQFYSMRRNPPLAGQLSWRVPSAF